MNRKRLVAVLLASLCVLMMIGCGSPVPTVQPTQSATQEATGTTEATSEPSKSAFPSAEIQNDEGGPVSISGEMAYTNLLAFSGVAEPEVLLEDETGFVKREHDYNFPVESQVLGKFTSDFAVSPVSYSLDIPVEPQAPLNDVDHNDETNKGVMVYAVAMWGNTWGNPYLEPRDQGGGGWSSAYASTKVSDSRDTFLEVFGGKYLIYSPDNQQGFPSGFGGDKKLFTDDDPIVGIPQGWTMVDMDTDPFTFDRSRHPKIDLLEPENSALDDFSSLSYTEAFDKMLERFRTKYAFTEYHKINWDEMASKYRPLFEDAEKKNDKEAYIIALNQFLTDIPDTHVGLGLPPLLQTVFQRETGGGLGMAVAETDDHHVYVDFISPDGPADKAGIQLNAEIQEFNGKPIDQAIDEAFTWARFGTPEVNRLQKLRYLLRSEVGTEVEVKYQNPNGQPATANLTSIAETESHSFSSFAKGITGTELPVEFKMLDNGYGYVKINSFFDTDVLTIQLWERMIQTLNQNEVPGLIIDLRQNGGGNGWLAAQMAAYFFDDPLDLGNTGFYDKTSGEFFFDPSTEQHFIPPPDEKMRFHGAVTAIVGPNCASACEFFAYDLTLNGRSHIVGEYPTAGAGGSVEDFLMPENLEVRMTIGRAVNAQSEIHLEGKGVVPDVRVPVTKDVIIAQIENGEDILLQKAEEVVGKPEGAGVTPTGDPKMDHRGDLPSQAQSGTKFLEDLANEKYTTEQLNAPGTYVYTIPMGASKDVLWANGWCATTGDILKQNLTQMKFTLTVNGKEVPESQIGSFEGNVGGQSCHYIWVLFTDWPIGEHVIVSTTTMLTKINDGTADYQPGDRVSEYHIIVNR